VYGLVLIPYWINIGEEIISNNATSFSVLFKIFSGSTQTNNANRFEYIKKKTIVFWVEKSKILKTDCAKIVKTGWETAQHLKLSSNESNLDPNSNQESSP
jgi:hypothetical protein